MLRHSTDPQMPSSTISQMETRLITIKDLSASDEKAWSALAERAVEPNPFFEPGFLLLASRHFEGFAKSRLLVVQEGSEFRGVLPIIDVERARIPPRLTMTTRGDPTMVSGLCVPLVDGSCVGQAVGGLLDGLRAGARRGELPGILSLKRLVENGVVIDALRREAASRGMPTFTKESWQRGLVTRAGSWESPLNRKRRGEIARLRRALSNDHGAEVSLEDRTLDPAMVSEFMTMEASGWKGRSEGSAIARTPEKIAWFREWCERWTKTGRVQGLALHLGETPIAMQYSILAGDGVFLFRTAYDDAYARYGPGAMLLESTLETLRKQTDAIWVDSSTDPGNEFLLKMLPERRTITMLLIGTGGMVDRMMVSSIPVMTRGVEEFRRVRRRVRRAGSKPRSEGETKGAQSSRVSSATSRVTEPSRVSE